jgi:hypothetical protein
VFQDWYLTRFTSPWAAAAAAPRVDSTARALCRACSVPPSSRRLPLKIGKMIRDRTRRDSDPTTPSMPVTGVLAGTYKYARKRAGVNCKGEEAIHARAPRRAVAYAAACCWPAGAGVAGRAGLPGRPGLLACLAGLACLLQQLVLVLPGL